MAVAVPLLLAAAGSAASARGSKKAAKGAKGPQVPAAFRAPLFAATDLITKGLLGQFGQGQSPFAAPINPLQLSALDQIGSLLPQANAAGQAGLQDALGTIRGISATGLDPAQIELIRDQLQPFFDIQRTQAVAGARESEAQGGRFFGSGGVRAETDVLSQLLAAQRAEVVPLALQANALRLGAAQSIPGLITSTFGALQGLGLNALQAGELARSIATQQLPIQGIPFLAQLMGATPLFNQPIPTNFLQFLGTNLQSLAGSRVFGGKGSGASPTGGPTQLISSPVQ